MKYNKNYSNRDFYKSAAWEKTSKAYLKAQHYVCERCGAAARLCHHKKWLNGDNVNNLQIALGFDNLEALCLNCHNAEHGAKHNKVCFNEAGEVVKVKESYEARQLIENKKAIEELLLTLGIERATKQPQE